MLENIFFMDFSWNSRVLWGVFKKSWLKLSTFNIRLSCMHLCKYLNQRLTRIGEWNSKSFQDVSKTKKKNMKKLSFITYFKIEFLLPLTSCRKVFGKMPALLSCESSVSVNKSPDRKKNWNHPHVYLFSSL